MSDRTAAPRGMTLLAVSVATFMLLLDVTVVNVALPAIERELDAGFTDLQWVVDAYALSLAALILIAGSLADRLGRRRMFLAGLGLFTCASLASGLAGGALALNLARAAQGAGGAAMLATSLALIADAFPAGERHVALAVWGAVSGAAVAVGPLVGGALVEALDWRWIFFVNVPAGLAAIALTRAHVRESRGARAGGVDWPGGLIFSAALAALVLALLRGNAEGWDSPVIVGLIAAAAGLLGAFVLVERRAAAPMLDLRLFRTPSTAGASIAVFAVASAAFSMLLFLTLYLQNVLGHGPLATGLRLLPITLGSFAAAAIAGHAGARLPARTLLAAGLALCSLGLLLMRRAEAGADWTVMIAGFVVVGLGVGIVNPTVAGTAIAIVEPARSGMASGLNNTFRLLGVATGVAALGAVFEHRSAQTLSALAPDAPPQFAGAVATGNLEAGLAAAPAGSRPALAHAAERAFVSGLDEILLVAAVVAAAGALLAALLVRRADTARQAFPAEAAAQPAAT